MFLISGPMAAGKSTVAGLLARSFVRGVHLEGDVFRRSIVAGRHEIAREPPPEALEQLRLRYGLAAAAGDAYFEAGFTVAVEDVVAGPLLPEYVGLIRSRPLHVVVLLPSREAITAREAARGRGAYAGWSVDELHDGFASGTPRSGMWLDSSEQTPAETVEETLRLTSS